MSSPPEQEWDAAARLVSQHPLAWVVSRDFNASVLPLLAERDAEGRIAAFVGHCALGNPLVADLRRDSSGLVLFNGPSGYISNRYVSNRDWAPTWNFAVLRFEVSVEWLPGETAAFVDRLLDHLEGGPGRWSTRELGERYGQMLSRIIGFRAHVRTMRPHFKLGQDETPETFREIVEHLPDAGLAAWMEAFVEGRA